MLLYESSYTKIAIPLINKYTLTAPAPLPIHAKKKALHTVSGSATGPSLLHFGYITAHGLKGGWRCLILGI